MPYLSASEVMIHEEALYHLYVPLRLPYLHAAGSCVLLQCCAVRLFQAARGDNRTTHDDRLRTTHVVNILIQMQKQVETNIGLKHVRHSLFIYLIRQMAAHSEFIQ